MIGDTTSFTDDHLQAENARLRAMDNPECDGTDDAHPAWWRGHEDGTSALCQIINAMLDGKESHGTFREPWESTRRRISRLRAVNAKLLAMCKAAENFQPIGNADDVFRQCDQLKQTAREAIANAIGEHEHEDATNARLRAVNADLMTALACLLEDAVSIDDNAEDAFGLNASINQAREAIANAEK